MPDDVPTLLENLLTEIQVVRRENAVLLQRLEEAALPARRQAAQQGDRLRLLKVSEIAFITTEDDGVAIHGADGQVYLYFEGIGVVWERLKLDQRLMKPHKSFIINLDQVRAVDNDNAGRAVFFYGWPDETTARVTNDNVAEFDRRLAYA